MGNKLSDSIKSGARAFLITEYKYLSIFVGVVAILLLILYSVDPPPKSDETIDGLRYSCCFLGGAILSALAGWQGMDVATDANVRTTQAADKKGLSVALRVAFTGGAVMGFTVVGLGLFGVSLFFYFMTLGRSGEESIQIVNAVDALSGFGFGASAIALFARVAGGIYTKAADVGADLVGKVEMDIPEDDPRNPAVIADNVGDNVGDVAGMGADLFESYVGSIIASATLGANYGPHYIALPFWLAAAGVLASIVGFFAVSTKEEGKGWNVKLSALMWALEKGMYLAGLLFLAFAAVIIILLFGPDGGETQEGVSI